ncbi:methylmalonyl-CoA mutase family protein [Streptosporangium sp. NBC_01755]|uniref:acyl-CoA mutase large subunit family protein n=1 Tax=unclassified Streptosporangium TaxID=2632669 RepID=UPI002DDA16E8|nr:MULTISPECIES: methylmalonyl-CoA mutase family protein [unclassified Streptosporangium]WSA26606.1 methylmalonyl-CoA mutase family protein [Streptosporangium sp. NBC_01810]WSD01970.1 methylmalonyl-CoA mutase family protein [Streptosporangium sp. NBC_01755]
MNDDPNEVTTDSGIPLEPIYFADMVEDGLEDRLGLPGKPPFTRGPYPTMYRERLWTMRQYAGYGSAEDTNARYRYLLSQGQTALSVAFDLPTQLGYDSTAPDVASEVGRVGVAIDTVEDMEAVFDGLPIGELSVNFTINATAPIILAFYLVAAERQGVNLRDVAGTLQNDILKEFLARKTFIFPPEASIRFVADVVEYASAELPRFNGISITGYHAREAGCNAIQEVGLTMASAIAYTEAFLARGLDFDFFAPRLSFHFSSQLDLFEEAAKVRAARRMWHRLATERFGAKQENSARLRFFSGCSGATLTAQQPLNNVVRSTLQCLAAVLGGAQSIHVMGYDEALEIPTEESVRLALRTQQIIAHESGVARVIDPLAGSYFVESLTDEIEKRAWALVDEVDAGGGLVELLAQGIPQRWVAESAYAYERQIVSGERIKVGVNKYTDDSDIAPPLFEIDETAGDRQRRKLRDRLAARDEAAVRNSLEDLDEALGNGANTMPYIMQCGRAGATLGEIADTMRARFGVYREPQLW